MIGFPPIPALDEIHTYLGNSWRFSSNGWKEYIPPVEATAGLQPFLLAPEVWPNGINPLMLPSTLEFELSGLVEADLIPVLLAPIQPKEITYI